MYAVCWRLCDGFRTSRFLSWYFHCDIVQGDLFAVHVIHVILMRNLLNNNHCFDNKTVAYVPDKYSKEIKQQKSNIFTNSFGLFLNWTKSIRRKRGFWFTETMFCIIIKRRSTKLDSLPLKPMLELIEVKLSCLT